MPNFYDAVNFLATSSGTGDFVVASAIQGYRTPLAAAVPNGATSGYYATSTSGNEWELGITTYATGTVTAARTTVIANHLGTTAKVSFTAAPNVAFVELSRDMLGLDFANSFTATQKAQAQSNIGVREVLAANRTYYVLTTGSDSNTGLVNTAGGAFLTLQKAMDTIAGLDCSIYSVTVNVGAGTYAALILKQYLGAGTVTFVGDATTPANVIISAAGQAVITSAVGGNFTLSGFQLQSSGSQDAACVSKTILNLDHINWNGSSANFRVYAATGGILNCNGANHRVLTGGIGLFLAEVGAQIYINNSTFTFAANVTYSSATATARRQAYIEAAGATMTLGGFTVTGGRYSMTNCSGAAGTGSTTFFPGTVAGTADATSFYS